MIRGGWCRSSKTGENNPMRLITAETRCDRPTKPWIRSRVPKPIRERHSRLRVREKVRRGEAAAAEVIEGGCSTALDWGLVLFIRAGQCILR